MADREKVVRELEALRDAMSKHQCYVCSHEFIDAADKFGTNIIEDAIALLKEQEHGKTFIVIDNKTGEEADTYDIALHEDWAKHLCYCDMEGWAIEDDGTLLLVDECGRFAYADRERFKVKWDDI